MTHRGLVRKLGGFILIVFGALAMLPGSAQAQTELVVDAGYGGYAPAGRAFPIRVSVTADALFTGELWISSQDDPTREIREIEVPGGTTREFVIVWEGNPWSSPRLSVQLVSGEDVVASASANARMPRNTDLVGVFPELAARGLPDKTPLTVDAGEALLFPIDPGDLQVGAGILGPLDMLVVTANDLRALDDTSLDALLAWVNQGGRLLVDEPSGAEVPGVPATWQPRGELSSTAGLGEIQLTNGAAAAGDWDRIVEPAPTRSRQEDGAFGELAGFWGGEPLSWSLGRDAGVSLPSTPWLVLIIGAYIVIAGPIVWFVARGLKRPGLAWLMIPAVSLLFTLGIWTLGSSFRSDAQQAHGTIVDVAPRGSTVATYSLVNSSSGGTTSVALPAGWSPISSYSEGFPQAVEISDAPGGAEMAIDLDAGGFAVIGGRGGSSSFDDAIEVTAQSSESGQVNGTVTNNLDIDLHEVVVFADQSGTNIGTVPAGQTVDYNHRGNVSNPFNGEPIEFRVWRDAMSPEFFGEFGRARPNDSAVNIGLWGELTTRWSLNARPVGQVMVAGWSDQLASPLDASVDAGRTLLVARAPIEPATDTLTDLSVRRDIVRGPDELGASFRLINRWGGGAMVRFVVPPEASGTALVLDVPRAQQLIEVWTGTEWRQIDIDENDSATLALPAELVASGRVYAKVLYDFERGLPAFRDLAVRSPRDGEDVAELVFVVDDEGSDA